MNQLRAVRHSKGLTLREVASQASVSIPYLSDVELGHRGAKPETWERIASALGVTVAEIKGGVSGADADHRADG